MTAEEQVNQLKEENERLRATIRQLRKQLESYKKRFRQDHDSLPYEEDDRR